MISHLHHNYSDRLKGTFENLQYYNTNNSCVLSIFVIPAAISPDTISLFIHFLNHHVLSTTAFC